MSPLTPSRIRSSWPSQSRRVVGVASPTESRTSGRCAKAVTSCLSELICWSTTTLLTDAVVLTRLLTSSRTAPSDSEMLDDVSAASGSRPRSVHRAVTANNHRTGVRPSPSRSGTE